MEPLIGQGLSSGVRELRCEVAERQILSDDYVVGPVTNAVVVASAPS